MFAIINGATYRLPFTTVVVDQYVRNHQHKDRWNVSSMERMELSIHLPALGLDALVPANNDNWMRSHG
jgi:hypothetical protein